MYDPGDQARPESTKPEQEAAQPIDPWLLRRLFIAFLIIAGLTVVSVIVLPRANLSIPWYVFGLTYIAIVAAALAPMLEGSDDAHEDDGDVAGRIGRGDGP